MDRQTVYPGQILPETSLLQIAKDTMIGVAKLSAAVFGTGTMANGFAVTPTGPASLQVVCAPGEIYSLTSIDALAYSSLPADTTHSIVKQGILLDGVTLNCPAPGTTGQSINYLVQVIYQDTDANPVLLPYYNSANPALPYSGMGNNGLTQNTVRKGAAIVAVKAGASAATGSQVTPAPDAGYVGLYVVSVAFGQTTITAGNIAQYSGAPLLPAGMVQAIQSGKMTGASDIGTANAYAANYTPAITIVNDTMTLCIKAANANTGASTFTPAPGVIAAAPVVGAANAALQGGEIVANGDVWLQWNTSVGGGSWVVLDSTGGALQIAPATKSQHAIQLGQVGHGQCRLSVASTTSLVLKPYNGNNVIVNGLPLQLPGAGVTVTNSGLSASTLYYAYLGGTTASPTLSLSATGHSTASNGIETKTGDATLTLVGMVYTNASTQFVDAAATRFCLNWFNRRKITGFSYSNPNYTFSNTGTLAEISTALRISFLSWADDAPVISQSGSFQLSATGTITSQASVDTIATGYTPAQGLTLTSSYSGPFSSIGGIGGLSEGQHFTICCAYVNAGTATLTSIQTVVNLIG